MKRFLSVPFVLSAIALAVLWLAGDALLMPAPQPALDTPSFQALPTAEPISPIPLALPLDRRKIALGKRLFHDTRLSRDNSVACASCHSLSKGGADGLNQAVGLGGQRGDLNAPTVFNSSFNFRQFWDGRAATLEDQIDGPLQSPKEMGSSWSQVVAKLAQDPDYAAAFHALYGGIEPAHIKDAIAEFERSLITPGSRFDRYLLGEREALSHEELKGYQLFKSYGCIACHQGVNVGGNLYSRLGVVKDYFKGDPNAPARDPGRMAMTGEPQDRHVFKVPGLRNVALTAPYFHDGSVQTLERAVVVMGEYQLGVSIAPAHVALIVKFLHTLTGAYEGTPL